MKCVRLAFCLSLSAVLTGCPNGDPCASVTCSDGQTCDSATGMCTGSGGGGETGGGAGGSGGADAGVDSGIPLAGACARVAEAACAKYSRCKQLDAPDQAACLAMELSYCTYDHDVMAGWTRFDGRAASECVAAYATQDCADPYPPSRCSQVTLYEAGQVGTACQYNEHCQEDAGLYCAINDFTRCRFCTARVGSAEFCAYDVDIRCKPGFTCDEQPSLDGGHCRPPGMAGDVCDRVPCATGFGVFCRTPTDGGRPACAPLFGDNGGPCTSSSQCEPQLYCAVGTPNYCRQRLQVDELCSSTGQCVAGTVCSTTTGRCTLLAVDGTPCTSGSQCASNYCNRQLSRNVTLDAGTPSCGFLTPFDPCYTDLDCGTGKLCRGLVARSDGGTVPGSCTLLDPDGGSCIPVGGRANDSCANPRATCLDGKCIEVPPFSRTLGQTCGESPDQPQCGGGSRCDFSDPDTRDGHCVALIVAGGACENAADCEPGSYCDFGFGICRAYAHRSELCDDFNGPYCIGTETCNQGSDGGLSCGAQVPAGSACDSSNGPQCYASFCAADGGCTLPQMNGAACDYDSQCGSGSCDSLDGGATVCVMACY
jgi:hypothetical protein